MSWSSSEFPPPLYTQAAINLPPSYSLLETMAPSLNPSRQDSDMIHSSASSPASLMLPLAASVQLEVPEIAGIHLLRPVQPATRSVKTSIAGWKKCLPHLPMGDWTSFRLTKAELRKKRFFSFQHEFLLMCLSNAEMAIDLLVQRNVRGNTKHAGTGLPEDTLSILSPYHLQSISSSTLVKSISWGGSSSPSFADIIIVLSTVIESFPMYTTRVFNCYHFCTVTYDVLSIFLPDIVPNKIQGKSKGQRIFWKKVVPDSIISRDSGLVMEKISKLTRRMGSERGDVVAVEGKKKAKEE